MKELMSRIAFFFRERRVEHTTDGFYLLINGEWLRVYLMFRDGVVALYEEDGFEYPRFIKYNKIEKNSLNVLVTFYMRRFFKERYRY